MAKKPSFSTTFVVRWEDTIFTAVMVIGGRWIDGNSGYDVTNGEYLGLHVGARYINGQRYDYYRQDSEMYQLGPNCDDSLDWLCPWPVADKFLVGIKAYEKRKKGSNAI